MEKKIEAEEGVDAATASATGPATPEELVEKERATIRGEPVPTGPTGAGRSREDDDLSDATGDGATGDQGEEADNSETGSANGSATESATGSATGGSATGGSATGSGANAHWKWIHGSGHGTTLLRHAKMLKGRKAGKQMII